MSNYAKLRTNAKRATTKKINAYKAGGVVSAPKKSGTTVNIVVSPARGESQAPIAPAGMIPPPSRSPAPPAPIPPVAAQAGLASMGAMPPPMKTGGRVTPGFAPMKGGAEGGLGRLQKARAAAKRK